MSLVVRSKKSTHVNSAFVVLLDYLAVAAAHLSLLLLVALSHLRFKTTRLPVKLGGTERVCAHYTP